MTTDFTQQVELSRKLAQKQIAEKQKKLAEQYFTPDRVSKIMAEMFSSRPQPASNSVLDPCCGVGNLAAAVVARALRDNEKIDVTLIEKDCDLIDKARVNFSKFHGVKISNCDFFDYANLDKKKKKNKFDRVILNPPYSKIPANSTVSKNIRSIVGHNETNLYSAFVACCLKLLSDAGELVALIPRSFCNGAMFRNFRKFILSEFNIKEIYLFESRRIFSESGVMQEMLIIKISREKSHTVKISHENKSGAISSKNVQLDEICFPSDEDKFIHVPIGDKDDAILSKMAKFRNTLLSSGFRASTGKIVDFRSLEWLKEAKSKTTVPMLYQESVSANCLVNPDKKSASAFSHIEVTEKTKKFLVARGNYVLVRRISFKEAPHRIVCSPLSSNQFSSDLIGIENHLNYIWGEKSTLTRNICFGLAAFLSTPSVDSYIRRFSGHTQINAADLNALPVPNLEQLDDFGKEFSSENFSTAWKLAEETFFS